ncbi:MAG: response regulator [Desulfobacteraceae bacterium]|nr:response regulator [Desulfobacteraceae bacterium]
MKTQPDILVIDDDKDLVETIRVVLESQGYEVRRAYNGKEGRLQIEKKIPDLIILDVMMSTDTEGFDLAYKLKQSKDYKTIPILMLTSFPSSGMVEKGPEKFQHIMGEEWPVTEFLEKPVNPDDLIAVIEEVLAEKKE